MSSRQSGSQNTLFNYFNKLSTNKNGNKRDNAEDNLNKENRNNTPDKRQRDTNEEEDGARHPTKRRRRIIEDSDSSDTECNDSVSNSKSSFNSKTQIKSEPDDSDTKETPKKFTQSKLKPVSDDSTPSKTPKKSDSTPSKTPKKSDSTPSKTPKKSVRAKLDDSQTKDSGYNSPSKSTQKSTNPSNDDDFNFGGEHSWLHTKLSFLKPENIRDKNGRRPSDPNYDPRTLYVPNDFLVKQTPAMQQWWQLKRDHYDCVLFFKVGKFYELYHMDAVVGVNELAFNFMKGEFAHSGFPESAYGRMSITLVEKGYKVARVEQTETPEAMSKRLQSTKGQKQSKVVSREICQITTKGTQVQGLQDLDFKQPLSKYLLAIYENKSNNDLEFGVCLVDSSIGTFCLGQFKDDNRYSRLLTMLAQYPTAVILEERKQLSNEVKFHLKAATGNASIESLNSESQFMSSTKTLKQLQENGYFESNNNGKVSFPPVLQSMISEDDPLNQTCKKEFDLAIRCLGACLWYLKDCFLDIQLFSLGKFELYVPADMCTDKTALTNKSMILDPSALSGLHILGKEATLEHTLDHCCTPMGKRLLHQWICKPLCDVEEIRNRQEAISELIQRQDLLNEAKAILKALPDLERLICRIHAMGNRKRAKDHPDSRAIFYEEKKYSTKKIRDFILTLNAFEKALSLGYIFLQFESTMLRKYGGNVEGVFPDIADTINHFKNSFDAEEAAKDGKIIPQKGVDAEYDASIEEIKDIESELQDYLQEQREFFGCEVNYFGSDKKRFQLEVPEHATHKVTISYSLEGTKKGSRPAKRYSTKQTKSLLANMIAAETRNKAILNDISRRILEKFSKNYDDWCLACHCLSVLDVLCSLAQYTINQSVTMCVPEVLPFNPKPVTIIRDGVHPFIPNIERFVPNDTELGTKDHSNILILTGPNMGGKSTLMRQVALLTIMAQLGCHVPASEMKFTLVDRIFTRLGAHDDIITGNSTFLVELKEAAAIIRHATPHSLVFLDELGRGTATYDGTAIATAYVAQLIKINCRTIFSTHYYSILDFYKGNNSIQLGHMACKVESDGDDVDQETVIFMYKMADGPCPKSYGFNAARLAGIPASIISRARVISRKLEKETNARKMFRKLLTYGEHTRELLSKLKLE